MDRRLAADAKRPVRTIDSTNARGVPRPDLPRSRSCGSRLSSRSHDRLLIQISRGTRKDQDSDLHPNHGTLRVTRYTKPMPSTAHEQTPRYKYTRAHRLSGDKEFQAVFGNKLRKNAGPLAVLALPNDLSHHRFGMTVPKRVGNAVKRHRIKRQLREAFRLNQANWPGRYDLVVVVYPHEVLKLDDYADHLARAVDQLHAVAEKRKGKQT